jgi:uncharacterized protein (DUF427 family)
VSLVAGKGPLGTDRAGWFSSPVPSPVVYVEPHPRRVQALVDGRAVIDTERVLMVHRAGQALSYVFQPEDVGDLPTEPEPEAPGWVHVPWDAVDQWLEEGRLLVHYPPNPYHRVDCRPTTRRLRVEVAGEVLVDTDDTIVLFETSVSTKLYVDPSHVRIDLLQPSTTTSYCNYKGHATWWSATVGGRVVEDIGWTYDEPLPESVAIRGWFSFDPEVADVEAELP